MARTPGRLSPHPWAHSARFYHIYPLGCCGAPASLHGAHPTERLAQLHGWIDHLHSLGVNAVWLGPLFAASSHGYDTLDYYHLDPRLGNEATLRELVRALHSRGIRVVLDAVFNHVGRDFWAFRDLRRNRQASAYTSWFQRLNFKRGNRLGDPFSYQGWKGHPELVKLKLSNPAVRKHLLGALSYWIQAFDIDGLRLDAADCISMGFLKRLAGHARALKRDFWLMGEVVHGDYTKWVHQGQLDALTNYELYHALHTSHRQGDYLKLAHSLQRQFGPHGVYRGLQLYNFVDNHDVTRINSRLANPALLYPLYLLLYTLPGIPSLYYGSEWGMEGHKGRHSDAALRPAISHPYHHPKSQPDLMAVISRLAALHAASPALQYGGWHLLHESRKTLAYVRHCDHENLLVVVHGGARRGELQLNLPWHHGELVDLLNPGERFPIQHSQVNLAPLHPYWGRILRWQSH